MLLTNFFYFKKGAAGIPQAGLVTLVMVLDTVGLPGNYLNFSALECALFK